MIDAENSTTWERSRWNNLWSLFFSQRNSHPDFRFLFFHVWLWMFVFGRYLKHLMRSTDTVYLIHIAEQVSLPTVTTESPLSFPKDTWIELVSAWVSTALLFNNSSMENLPKFRNRKIFWEYYWWRFSPKNHLFCDFSKTACKILKKLGMQLRIVNEGSADSNLCP